MRTLVTGVAGFIGFHLAKRLLEAGDEVQGIDNLSDYYSPRLKRDRLAKLGHSGSGDFFFEEIDFADHLALERWSRTLEIDRIVHLGAQPGVRYSINNPRAYVEANLAGHLNILELARSHRVSHLVYASSSSVYGANPLPFRTEDRTDWPISLYAATKRADELMSESYSHLFRIPQTGLRFFTVYGPWGRPDMAPWIFTSKVLNGEPVPLFNRGRTRRDFTYIDDIIDGVLACLDRPPADDGSRQQGGSTSPHRIYNIGNHRAVETDYFLQLIEAACGRSAVREMQPEQPGDVEATFADIEPMRDDFGFEPRTTLEDGVPKFVEWFKAYHGL